MTARKAISKKTRFEVFKRDGFKCQYCGATAPETILVVDHIEPVSKQGAHDMMNFITACQPCNAGKSDRQLSDDTSLQKQKAQLAELNERREQLEMMLKWRDGMQDIAQASADAATKRWETAVPGWFLNDTGKAQLKKLLGRYGLPSLLDAIDTAALQYVKFEDGKPAKASVELAWAKVGGVLRLAALPEDVRRLHYVKGILRNRLNWMPYEVMKVLESAMRDGVSVDDMQFEAKHATTWTRFLDWLEAAREDAC